MALESGRVSLSRYKILGGPTKKTPQKLGDTYRKYLARPVKLEHGKELRFGWDVPLGWDVAEAGGHWDLSHCAFQDGYLLRIRIERRKVPRSLLSQLLKEELIRAQKSGKPLDRKQKKALKEELQLTLMEKALPELKTLDVIWNTTKDELQLLSAAKGDREVFEKLFRQSFSEPLDLIVFPVTAPLLGLTLHKDGQEDPLLKRLRKTTPSLFRMESLNQTAR